MDAGNLQGIFTGKKSGPNFINGLAGGGENFPEARTGNHKLVASPHSDNFQTGARSVREVKTPLA
jgi:hypothetical protein